MSSTNWMGAGFYPHIEGDVKLDYDDVLLVPRKNNIKSRSDVQLHDVYFEDGKGIPIIAANMDGVGTFEMAKVLAKNNMMTALIKHYSLHELLNFYDSDWKYAAYVIYSMGTSKDDFDKFGEFNQRVLPGCKPYYVCIDVANGYSSSLDDFLIDFVQKYKQKYQIMVGNVVTPERVKELIAFGANIVKIGIGPGSVCTTRKLTGVGYPQFSAVLECARAARAAGGQVVADGGITCPGDAAKAFGAGASFVMIGGMFAGHDEGGGESVWPAGCSQNQINPPTHKKFYGMASKEAQHKYHGGVADYRASEGKEVLVPYKGPVEHTVKELLGGLRSACAYCGAEKLSDLYKKASFIKVQHQINNVFGAS